MISTTLSFFTLFLFLLPELITSAVAVICFRHYKYLFQLRAQRSKQDFSAASYCRGSARKLQFRAIQVELKSSGEGWNVPGTIYRECGTLNWIHCMLQGVIAWFSSCSLKLLCTVSLQSTERAGLGQPFLLLTSDGPAKSRSSNLIAALARNSARIGKFC